MFNPIARRMTKTLWSFGCSECNRVKAQPPFWFWFPGNQDAVHCFYCGGVLRNWEPDDDPWREHRHWFPYCEFLKTQPPRESSVEITPVMRRCIDMGYDQELVQAASQRKRRSGGRQFQDNSVIRQISPC